MMRVRVTPDMTARFFDREIHPLYATFVLVEHSEYASRQAIRPFLEAHEDAVGALIELEHIAPTPVGWMVEIRATVVLVEGSIIDCDIIATNYNGIIARGRQRQRVVRKERLRSRIAELYASDVNHALPVATAPDQGPQNTDL
jgi:predicted thioesterase